MKVLVIEEDDLVRETVRNILRHEGFDLAAAKGGDAALASTGAPADVILCGLEALTKGGGEKIRELRRELPQAALVAVSDGGCCAEEGLEVARCQADGVLAKPFGREGLLAAIQQALLASGRGPAGRAQDGGRHLGAESVPIAGPALPTRVLIAGSTPLQGEVLARSLRPWGYGPVVVRDGHSALEALGRPGAPRLALLDVWMPALGGLEVCRLARALPNLAGPYLILTAGHGGVGLEAEGLEAGADDFLRLPTDPAVLKARLGAGRRVVEAIERLEELATCDSLTGVLNRGAILSLLQGELARSARQGQPVGVALADVDHFKRVNDTCGHPAGDLVLRQLAERMRASLRPYDGLGRYGGEEFLAVLPGCDTAATAAVAERMRTAVAADPIRATGGAPKVTVSFGVAAWTGGGGGDATALLTAADEALYRAKHAGRDQVVIARGVGRGSRGTV